MRWTMTLALRVGATTSLVLTLISLALPIYEVAEYLPDLSAYVYYGRDGALVGWLFVLGLASPAWLANVPWMWNIARMFSGRAPNWITAVAGPALAATAYQRFPIGMVDRAANSYGEPMFGIVVWIIAQVIPLLALFCLHQMRPDAKMETDQRT